MTALTELSLAEAGQGLEAGDFTAEELTRACIEALEGGRDLNAFITETPDIAVDRAKASDARRADGKAAGPMDGIPIAVKDLFCTEGVLTTAGSHILDGFTPAYESTVSANLKDSGAVMLGKTNMDEFAMGSANVTSYYGPVKNPWKGPGGKDMVPGGSSGGSAAAVAGGLCPGAIGTDTGGSIRQPASFTGIVGMKPTYGRCSRWGIVAFASSLDQAGPLTRTVEDAAIMLGAMAGHDAKDSTSAPIDVADFSAGLKEGVKGMKVGIPEEYTLDGMPAEIEALWQQGMDWLKGQGAECIDVSLPHTKYALPAYYIVAPAEASSNLARYDGVKYGYSYQDTNDMWEAMEKTREYGFGPEVTRRVMLGTYALSSGYYDAYYLKAQQVRTLIKQDFDRVFQEVDALVTPTSPVTAFKIGEKIGNPVQMYLIDVCTLPVNIAGLPGLSVPCGGFSTER